MADQDERLPFKLQGGEQVVDVCRRHWWFLWPRTILWTLIAIVPVVLAAVGLNAAGWLDDIDFVFWIVALVWLGFWGVRLLLNWYQYRRDIWVVTNQRIIDSVQPHPFRHHLSTADLVNIQDMTVEKHGVIATILNFGDVVCQTAGTGQEFRIATVPDPQSVQHIVDRERDRERRSYAGGTAT